MPHHDRVAVLLATYNGEKFLDAQIQSILDQTHANLGILARDDGSTDRTPEILRRWAAEHPTRIAVIEDGRGNVGVRENFSILMGQCREAYFLPCDQDDIWLPEKIDILLTKMKALEHQHGTRIPILIHSDLALVDAALNPIAPSFWNLKNMNTAVRKSYRNLLIENIATGCACMGNAALLRLGQPVPPAAIIHDWWLALVAKSYGVLYTLPRQTVLYRQHGGNVIGAGRDKSLWEGRHIVQRPGLMLRRFRRLSATYAAQAAAVRDLAPAKLPDSCRRDIERLCLLARMFQSLSPFRREILYPGTAWSLLRSTARLFRFTH